MKCPLDANVNLWWDYQITKIRIKNVKLKYLEESFTMSNWIMRVYKDKAPGKPPNFYHTLAYQQENLLANNGDQVETLGLGTGANKGSVVV